RHRRVPDRRRAGDHAPGHAPEALRETTRTVEADERTKLARVAGVRLGRRQTSAQLLDLSSELLVLRLRVDDVADPTAEVARRLQGAAGAFLKRRHRLHRSSLDRMERARARLAEIGGEKRYG